MVLTFLFALIAGGRSVPCRDISTLLSTGEGTITVLVSTMHNLDGNQGDLSYAISAQVAELLENASRRESTSASPDLNLLIADCNISSADQAEKILFESRADIVLWGSYSHSFRVIGSQNVSVGSVSAGSNSRISIGNSTEPSNAKEDISVVLKATTKSKELFSKHPRLETDDARTLRHLTDLDLSTLFAGRSARLLHFLHAAYYSDRKMHPQAVVEFEEGSKGLTGSQIPPSILFQFIISLTVSGHSDRALQLFYEAHASHTLRPQDGHLLVLAKMLACIMSKAQECNSERVKQEVIKHVDDYIPTGDVDDNISEYGISATQLFLLLISYAPQHMRQVSDSLDGVAARLKASCSPFPHVLDGLHVVLRLSPSPDKCGSVSRLIKTYSVLLDFRGLILGMKMFTYGDLRFYTERLAYTDPENYPYMLWAIVMCKFLLTDFYRLEKVNLERVPYLLEKANQELDLLDPKQQLVAVKVASDLSDALPYLKDERDRSAIHVRDDLFEFELNGLSIANSGLEYRLAARMGYLRRIHVSLTMGGRVELERIRSADRYGISRVVGFEGWHGGRTSAVTEAAVGFSLSGGIVETAEVRQLLAVRMLGTARMALGVSVRLVGKDLSLLFPLVFSI